MLYIVTLTRIFLANIHTINVIWLAKTSSSGETTAFARTVIKLYLDRDI